MEGLTDLIRNLAIILLIASFLEMLLPHKKMRGYVQLVIGLFIISALLNPISQLLSMPLEMAIPAWNSPLQADLPVIADDTPPVSNTIHEQYRLILCNQIRALALGVEGVKDARVEVGFDSTNEDFLTQPQIARVDIFLTDASISISPVEPVTIGNDPGGEQAKETSHENHPVMENVRKRVVSLMQIPEDKINIYLES